MHCLYLGMTGSGKTTLAKEMARKFRAQGFGVLVLDPMGDDWAADFQTDDPNHFLAVVAKSTRCAVFVDESGETIGHYEKDMFWLATRARHYGHSCHFITQRAAQLSPTVRDQCGRMFLFRVSTRDADILANEWAEPTIKCAAQLERYAMLYCERYGGVKRGRVTLGKAVHATVGPIQPGVSPEPGPTQRSVIA